jgi:hypothetical protein
MEMIAIRAYGITLHEIAKRQYSEYGPAGGLLASAVSDAAGARQKLPRLLTAVAEQRQAADRTFCLPGVVTPEHRSIVRESSSLARTD